MSLKILIIDDNAEDRKIMGRCIGNSSGTVASGALHDIEKELMGLRPIRIADTLLFRLAGLRRQTAHAQ